MSHEAKAKELARKAVAESQPYKMDCASFIVEALLVRALAACALESRLEALEDARLVCLTEKMAWLKMDRWLVADAADNCEIGIRGLIAESGLERAAGEGKS